MSRSSKVVVVNGASQGIGAAIVKVFRKLDYRIVATSRSIKVSDDVNILLGVLDERLADCDWVMVADADISLLGWVRNLIGSF